MSDLVGSPKDMFSHIAAHLIKNIDYPNNIVPGLEVFKNFSCSTQLRLKFILLINDKMPTLFNLVAFTIYKQDKFQAFEF